MSAPILLMGGVSRAKCVNHSELQTVRSTSKQNGRRVLGEVTNPNPLFQVFLKQGRTCIQL